MVVRVDHHRRRLHRRARRDQGSDPLRPKLAEMWPNACNRGFIEERKLFSIRSMRLDECHRITKLHKIRSWSLCIHGPVVRTWGFFLPGGWMQWRKYEDTVRAERRDMHAEISSSDPDRVKI